jgi:hypothetical protein
MLSSVKKFRSARNEFIYPYLIQTDAKGFIITVSDQVTAFFSDHHIIHYLYKNISNIFARLGRSYPSFTDFSAGTSSQTIIYFLKIKRMSQTLSGGLVRRF